MTRKKNFIRSSKNSNFLGYSNIRCVIARIFYEIVYVIGKLDYFRTELYPDEDLCSCTQILRTHYEYLESTLACRSFAYVTLGHCLQKAYLA